MCAVCFLSRNRNQNQSLYKLLNIQTRESERLLACVAGVNGEGEGERERGRKMGSDEGTPAIKTPIFPSPPTDF